MCGGCGCTCEKECAAQCSPGCPTHWISDGWCDAECQNEACQYDGGDCDLDTKSRSRECGDVAEVPQEYVDTGVAADVVIFVLSSQDCPQGVLAYASHCQVDHNDRPTFGYIQMCAGTHQPKELAGHIDEDFHTAVHEIGHILGMSSALFPFWRDENNKPRTLRCPEVYEGDSKDETGLFYEGKPVLYWKPPYDQVGWCCDASPLVSALGFPPFRCEDEYLNFLVDKSVIEVAPAPPAALDFAGRKQTLLKTPKVVALARQHFGCHTLAGVEIEDDGGPGTAGSHWEKRHVMNEFMAGSPSGFANSKSALTLGLMEDTGWYRADFSRADALTWGYQYGCDFLLSCSAQTPPPPRGFCELSPNLQCAFDRPGIGHCDGEGFYIESCPFVRPAFLCSNWNGAAFDRGKGQAFSSTSACFESTLMVQGFSGGNGDVSAQPPLDCHNDLAWDSGYGDCISYEKGGNVGYCVADNVCDACGCSCAEECRGSVTGSGEGQGSAPSTSNKTAHVRKLHWHEDGSGSSSGSIHDDSGSSSGGLGRNRSRWCAPGCPSHWINDEW